PDGSAYRGSLPGTPQKDPKGGPGFTGKKYLLSRKAANLAFAVAHAEIGQRLYPTPGILDQLAQAERDNLLKLSGGRLLDERRVTSGNVEGRGFRFEGAHKTMATHRISLGQTLR